MESNELSCQEVVALVTDYLEQVLLPEIQTAVDEHVEGCPGCRTYYDQMQQTIGLLRQLTQEPMLPGTREELLQKFQHWRERKV